MGDHDGARLRAAAVQLIEVDDGVLLKRGLTEFVVGGPNAREIVSMILTGAVTGATREDLGRLFAPSDRPAVDSLLGELVARRILQPVGAEQPPDDRPESELDVFYWQLGLRTGDVAAELGGQRVAIVGVNQISRRLAQSMAASGLTGVEVVDFNLLRNVRLFEGVDTLAAGEWPAQLPAPVPYADWAKGLEPKELACVVVTADFGATQQVREWNQFCVEEGRPMLPVVLRDFVGFVGPLVLPGETACYECLRGRENANMDDPDAARLPERVAFRGQLATGFHPAMASVLGDIAAMELLKFFGVVPGRRAGNLVEVNLLLPEILTRRVLVLPRCPVCSPLNRVPSSTPYKDEYMHEPQ